MQYSGSWRVLPSGDTVMWYDDEDYRYDDFGVDDYSEDDSYEVSCHCCVYKDTALDSTNTL